MQNIKSPNAKDTRIAHCNDGHTWELIEEKIECSVLDSRGSGPYNDPCYGALCPCEGVATVQVYRCKNCHQEKKIIR